MKALLATAAALFAFSSMMAAGGAGQAQPARAATAVPPARAAGPDAAFLAQYCITCHNDRVKAGALTLAGLDVAAVDGHAEVWEKVVRKLRTGMMPPDGVPKPTGAARDAFTGALEASLDRAAMRRPDPGTPALHRLNRAEYANAIRDLLALDVDVAALLPPDDSAAGFDNIADVLGVSPALIEGYAAAAASISRRAIGSPTIGLDRTTYRMPGDVSQDAHVDGQPLGTRGGLIVTHTFPLDAEYDLQVGQAGGARLGGPPAGGPRTDDLYVTLDGVRVTLQGRGATRMKVAAGPHTIAAASVVRSHAGGADGVYHVETRTPGITQLTVAGPFNPTGPGDTPSRRRLLVCTPASAAEELGCARKILSTLATRAYRRPVAATSPELDTPLQFYRDGRQRSFEFGIERAVARILVDPQFLFRFEREPARVAAGAAYRVSDLELASRLSFFLWSSVPDDELIAVASKGGLSTPATLERQVRRMLADPRADALVTNFAAQWLYLRELQNARPDTPEFDGNLRQSFQKETELLFRTILRENRSIVDLLDANFTFVDERLARHYGIPGIRGSRMRRVELPPDSPRRGLLGQGSILTVTSAANRTSPVQRGKWVLENVLGAPPPQPPPGVETNIDGDTSKAKAVSLRQRMEQHRANAACASCHRIMDPIGFALENFDHAGKWRALDGQTPIDATGVMVDGSRLDGAESLRRTLVARPELFAGVAAEKMLTYALGRALRAQDMPAVRAITHDATPGRYTFSSLVLGVVRTPQFQMRTKSPAAATAE
jgi:cytochrome c553